MAISFLRDLGIIVIAVAPYVTQGCFTALAGLLEVFVINKISSSRILDNRNFFFALSVDVPVSATTPAFSTGTL